MSTTIFKRIYLIAFFVIPALAHADEKLSLSRILEMVRNHNPDVAITQARSNQSSALSGEGLILPPPTLTYGSMGMNGALNSNGKMENSFGISQMIPFPSKLFTDSNVRHYEALSIEKELSGEVLKAYKEAKSAFFTLLGARKKIVLLDERESVLEDHFKRVNSTSLSDRIAQAHRTWVQTEIELVKNDLIAAHEEEKSASGNLNYIVGSDPDSVIPTLDEPPISELPVTQNDIKSSQPELSSIDASLKAAQANLSQAKALWLPDFNLSYRNARRFDGVMPNYTEVTIGVTLPFLFFWEPKAQVAAASARTEELEARLEKTRRSLKLELLQTRARAESLHAQLLNYEQKIIPQAVKRMHLAHGLVPSDMESFFEHRDAMLSIVDLKLAQLNMRIEYEKILSKLETLLAGDVPEKDKI